MTCGGVLDLERRPSVSITGDWRPLESWTTMGLPGRPSYVKRGLCGLSGPYLLLRGLSDRELLGRLPLEDAVRMMTGSLSGERDERVRSITTGPVGGGIGRGATALDWNG